MSTLRIAMLHLAPRLGDLAHNRQLVTTAVNTAAAHGAAWILTPELCLCGYQFSRHLGTAWIEPQPDAWMTAFSQHVARLGVTVFLGHIEREAQTEHIYNTVFVIAPDGTLLGKHRKLNIVPVAEAWSSRGAPPRPIHVPPLTVGILICADAYTPEPARLLQAQGAQLLVSAAAWGPWPHGPDGAWEQRTRETGLPLFVCNRTGADDTLSFLDAESVIIKNGERLLALQAPVSTLLLVDWDLQTQMVLHQESQPL
ncbi:MAG: carbon-nitrogen hydrolase family protein [Candidatus Tectimicrobiota bacterium]